MGVVILSLVPRRPLPISTPRRIPCLLILLMSSATIVACRVTVVVLIIRPVRKKCSVTTEQCVSIVCLAMNLAAFVYQDTPVLIALSVCFLDRPPHLYSQSLAEVALQFINWTEVLAGKSNDNKHFRSPVFQGSYK